MRTNVPPSNRGDRKSRDYDHPSMEKQGGTEIKKNNVPLLYVTKVGALSHWGLHTDVNRDTVGVKKKGTSVPWMGSL